jgi:flavin-dependent dehydrogenase
MMVKSSTSSIHSDIVVDAEGVTSRFVKRMGLTPLRQEGVLPALQFELTEVDVDPDYAEIYFGKTLAPGFFVWVIPLSDDTVRVGLACRDVSLLKRLKTFINTRFHRFVQMSIHSGHVITGGPIPRTYDDNFIVVGDAAGQVKMTTGGGVILGGICAMTAGEILGQATHRGTYSRNFLGRYEKLWKSRLGREFRLMRFARKTANQLSDRVLDKLFHVIIKKNLHAELSINGDMDYQADSISSFIKKRDLVKIFITAIPEIINFNT